MPCHYRYSGAMVSLRERVSAAALELVGTLGIHALSHARVDAAAGLPRGSTSNYFRTRAALLTGVVEALVARDEARWESLYGAGSPSVDGVVEALASYVEAATGTDRVLTIARYTLFMESLVNDQISGPLLRARSRLEHLASQILTDLAVPDPAAAAATIFTHVDGMIMHRLTFPASTDSRQGLRTVVEAMMPG